MLPEGIHEKLPCTGEGILTDLEVAQPSILIAHPSVAVFLNYIGGPEQLAAAQLAGIALTERPPAPHIHMRRQCLRA